jgi:hypothetical protein
MKKLVFLSMSILSVGFTARANSTLKNYNTATTVSDTASLSNLLALYYNIKDALVAGSAESAAASAGEFVKAVNSVDMKSLSESGHSVFMSVNNKLAYDARHISETKDIDHQREHFKSLSDNFFLLAKKVKMSALPVYQEYCPMKKAYWLSSETTIRNPYLGNQMLDCGKVTATLK